MSLGPTHPFRSGPEHSFKSRSGITTLPLVTGVSPNGGRISGGEAITITGLRFLGVAPVVLFNGVAATSVVVVSDTTITCVAPAQTDPGVVDVSVSLGSETGTLFGGYTYVEGVVTKISPAFGLFGGGTRVVITGYNFVAGSTVAFGGTLSTDVTFIDSEHFSVVTPNHSVGFVDVVITEPLGAVVTFRSGFQFTLLTRGDDIRRQPGITVHDVLNNTPNTCSFTVDGNSNVPIVGEMIEITDSEDGDRRLFKGTVTNIEQIYEGQTDQLAWNVQCTDFTFLFNRRRPVGVFTNVSVSEVVISLVTQFAPGFTTNHVQTNLAKVTVTLDGSKDFSTVMNDLAAAIGGGHWKIDYNQDVHFFHTVPESLAVPPSLMLTSTDHLTVAEGSNIPTTFRYDVGFYLFRHSFVYSDGSESSVKAVSNMLFAGGDKLLSFTGIPLGVNTGTLTCVGRRIYVNKFLAYASRNQDDIETIKGFVEINDNTTTAFTTHFKAQGASVATVVDLPETQAPIKAFTGHPAGPANPPTLAKHVAVGGTDLWQGGCWQTKVAFLYRDGSVSFPSPASNTVTQQMLLGQGFSGWDVTNIPVGPAIGGLDVVARFLYFGWGLLKNPNFSLVLTGSGSFVPGTNASPEGFLDPTWGANALGIVIVPDNLSTQVVNFSGGELGYPGSNYPGSTTLNPLGFADGGSATVAYPGLLVGGQGKNLPYDNGSVLSTDPIPIWPNPDGPSLEDADPPGDLTNFNVDLLHGESGSQPFVVETDISQVRNRVIVLGSGSVSTLSASIGDDKIFVNDIASFSPAGGRVRIDDLVSNTRYEVGYAGVTGVPGKAAIQLSTTLTAALAQGAIIVNIFQADDIESQKFLSQIELDKDGNTTDGIHEFVVSDSSLKAVFQLFMRAHAELEMYSRPLVTIKYATRDPKSTSGQTVLADMTDPPCQGSFLIQDVTIDQIHDESDTLMPRYTVIATSSRFELNDLLLKILSGNTGGSSPSNSGVAAAGTFAAVQNIPSLPYVRKTAWAGLQLDSANFGTTSACGTYNVGAAGNAGTATSAGSTATGVTDDTGTWNIITTGANTGNEARLMFPNAAAFCYVQHNPKVVYRIRTGPSVAAMRIFFLLGTTFTPNNADTNTALFRMIGIKFSSVLGGGWVGFIGLSSTSAYTVTSQIAPILSSTIYTLSISISGGVATFDVNGAKQSLSVPSAINSVGLMPTFRMFTLEDVTKSFQWQTAYCERD